MAVCGTCPHACDLKPGKLGLCRARRCEAGGDGSERIVPEAYGRIASLALDDIEKKPIARWHPGTTVLSLGGYGCNMRCPFCQNWTIAQVGSDELYWEEATPEQIVRMAQKAGRRCIGIAYTYNEPLITWEFVRDTGRLAHDAGLLNVLVSNGNTSAAVLGEVAPLIDAANIDLKCFTAEGYRSLGGDFVAVKRTIETLAALETCHLEVTTLAVPGFSDDETQIAEAAGWLASLDPSIPYHLTRFAPHHRMRTTPRTPIQALYRLRDVASTYLDDVMLGNV